MRQWRKEEGGSFGGSKERWGWPVVDQRKAPAYHRSNRSITTVSVVTAVTLVTIVTMDSRLSLKARQLHPPISPMATISASWSNSFCLSVNTREEDEEAEKEAGEEEEEEDEKEPKDEEEEEE